MKEICKFLELHLGIGMFDPDKTDSQMLTWVSVCSELARDLNLRSLVWVFVCDRLFDVELHA